jgi:maltose O-acetyltransferase
MINLFKRFKKKKFNWKNTMIDENSDMYFPENISMGEYVYIGKGAFFDAKGGITIGNNVIIGPKCTIISFNHNYKSDTMLPYDNKEILKPVTIKDNVWIGINVNICPGVTIEEGAVIAMGSLVTKDIPYCAIAGGNPAKVLGYRDTETYEKIKKEGCFYMKMKLEGKIQEKQFCSSVKMQT